LVDGNLSSNYLLSLGGGKSDISEITNFKEFEMLKSKIEILIEQKIKKHSKVK
jgi:hypothetical protein